MHEAYFIASSWRFVVNHLFNMWNRPFSQEALSDPTLCGSLGYNLLAFITISNVSQRKKRWKRRIDELCLTNFMMQKYHNKNKVEQSGSDSPVTLHSLLTKSPLQLETFWGSSAPGKWAAAIQGPKGRPGDFWCLPPARNLSCQLSLSLSPPSPPSHSPSLSPSPSSLPPLSLLSLSPSLSPSPSLPHSLITE